MAAGDVITVKINEVVASGDGLARFGSKAVFVNNSCVDETVVVRIYREQATWARAELQKIVGKASPDRVKPRCEFYGKCGGCTMQHLSYEAQLNAKVARFIDKFKHIAGFRPPDPRVVASRQWEFRNYMQFNIKKRTLPDADTGIALGLENFRGDGFVPLADCPIADPRIRSLLQNTAQGRPLTLAPNTDKYYVYSWNDVYLTDAARRFGKINILDKEISVSINAYIPSNISVMETLIADLSDIADSADHNWPMADLYCGIGTFSAFLADDFPGADLVDENPEAIYLARHNVTAKKARFFTVKDRNWVRDTQPRPGYYGFMVVDPPATLGLHRNILDWIVLGGPPLLVYLSQDGAAFARDAAVLCSAGYRLTQVTIYDFSPHAGFTDTMAVFDGR